MYIFTLAYLQQYVVNVIIYVYKCHSQRSVVVKLYSLILCAVLNVWQITNFYNHLHV